MNQDVKYQFFISSTVKDLRRERSVVQQAVLAAGHIPIGMELFPGTDETSWEVIKKAIKESDYFLTIIGNCCGSVSKEHGISYTEREYDIAVEMNKPIIRFVSDDNRILKSHQTESDIDKFRLLTAFREKVTSDKRETKFWKNRSDLDALVTKAINYVTNYRPQVGWVRNEGTSRVELLETINTLSDKLRDAESLIAQLKTTTSERSADSFDTEILSRSITLIYNNKDNIPREVSLSLGKLVRLVVERIEHCHDWHSLCQCFLLFIKQTAELNAASISSSHIRNTGQFLWKHDLIEIRGELDQTRWRATKLCLFVYDKIAGNQEFAINAPSP